MPSTTAKGVPYSLGTDTADTIDTTMQALAEWVDARPGVSPLTTAARDAIVATDLWDGRVIWNNTTAKLERYNAGTTSWLSAAVGLSGGDTITASGTGVVPLRLKLAEAHASDAFQLLDSGNGIRVSMTKNGAFFISPSAGGGQALVLVRRAAGETNDFLALQNDTGVNYIRITATGQLLVDTSSTQSNARVSLRAVNGNVPAANALEWGHSNQGGYGSTMGFHTGSGNPFLAFFGEAGSTTSNTFRSRGLRPVILQAIASTGHGTLQLVTTDSVNADDQPGKAIMSFGTAGVIVVDPRQNATQIDSERLVLYMTNNQTQGVLQVRDPGGTPIVNVEPRVNGTEGAHLRLLNPKPWSSTTPSQSWSPFFLLESRNWDSATGNQAQYGGMYLGHESMNNPAPTSALIFTGSRDGGLVDLAYMGPNNGLVMYGNREVGTGGNVRCHHLALDYNGDGKPRGYVHMLHADAGQIAFLEDPAGDTLYKNLRAAGFVTVSSGGSKTEVQPLSLDDGAVAQGRGVRLPKAATTRPLNDRLRELVPVSYKQKRGPDAPPLDKNTSDPTLYSFVAEEAALVVPEVVSFDAAGKPSGIDIGALSVLTLAAVQSVMARLDRLENPPAPDPAPAPAPAPAPR